KQEKLHSFYTSKSRQARDGKQESSSKRRQARVVKQESASKSHQARVDKKETGGKQETAIDEKAENTVKECTNWKDKKKDKEQEALLISEDSAFVITGENIGQKPNPDLGARISLMSYTMYKKLGLGEPKATRMSLELADRSIQYPRGIIENVLIKVDKFVLPIDFVILDIPEDSRVPIILGRPFLATARAMIDVFNKKIPLRVRDDEVVFDVDQSIKRPTTEDDEYLECCESTSSDEKNGTDLEKLIRRIDFANMPYSVKQATINSDNVKSEHLYSASTNEIDEKKPELKNLPQHLEYAYLHGDKSFPIIISSELSEKEKVSLLQVLERRKGEIAWKMSDIKGISSSYCTHKILMEDDYKPVI
ncbi:DNA-directed DNA polymerase, partial [Tanacetum coccineum]